MPSATEGRQIELIARKFLLAIKEAGRIYRLIESSKGKGNFITEVSLDESDESQSPTELFFILAAIADEGIPVQTIAPKFSGRFLKGVDYEGDVAVFEKEFEQHIAVIGIAVREFGLPDNLKLSVHSGSDKFSLWEPIRRALERTGAGLHVKTAGTTWLEELAGLASVGEQGVKIAKTIYRQAWERRDELCRPYAAVVAIDAAALPAPGDVQQWGAEQFASTLAHDPCCPNYNRNFRQLLHVAYKIAAEMGEIFIRAIEEHESIVASRVTANILDRHLTRIFPIHANRNFSSL